MLRLSESDYKAVSTIYNKYWKLLFSVACKKLGNSAEAEEIVQDIFLDLWNRRNTIQLDSNLSSYLSVSVNYKVLRILARRELHSRYQDFQSNKTDNYL